RDGRRLDQHVDATRRVSQTSVAQALLQTGPSLAGRVLGMSSMITSAGPGVGLAQRLVGRVRERCLLDGLVESVEVGGAAVVIAGEAGVGKTALLTHVADVASERGVRVLRACGEESEAVLAFATLADLLRPSREKFAELPPAQRQALEVC